MPKAEPLPPSALVDPAVARCPSACVRPGAPSVTLLSGVAVCSYCPSWLAETFARQVEARSVLAMADKPARVAHLAARERVFGPEYRARLAAVVLDLWESRRRSAAEVTHG